MKKANLPMRAKKWENKLERRGIKVILEGKGKSFGTCLFIREGN